MMAVSKVFLEKDASLVEINPLVVTPVGDVLALDAKINFDDNALFRHKDIAALRDESEEDPAELRATSRASASSSSTARLAVWSTAPAWRWGRWTLSSTTAANRPTSSMSAAARTRIRSPKHSVFCSAKKREGGPGEYFRRDHEMRYDCRGDSGGVRRSGISCAVSRRLEGTNVEQGRKLLAESGKKITTAAGMAEAAQKVVAAAKGELA